MYDSRLRLANQIYDEVKKHFQELVFKTVIQRNVKLSEAPSHGLPVILYDTDSTGSKNHLALAKEIIEKRQITEKRMAVHKKYPALGRGLDALISTKEVHWTVPLPSMKSNWTRFLRIPTSREGIFDPESLRELADSIAEIGIVQPITLRKMEDDTFQIIAGERRWRASKQAGLHTIPAYIRTADDENVMEMALIENIQREDLNSVEIALAYQHLIEQYNLTQREIE